MDSLAKNTLDAIHALQEAYDALDVMLATGNDSTVKERVWLAVLLHTLKSVNEGKSMEYRTGSFDVTKVCLEAIFAAECESDENEDAAREKTREIASRIPLAIGVMRASVEAAMHKSGWRRE